MCHLNQYKSRFPLYEKTKSKLTIEEQLLNWYENQYQDNYMKELLKLPITLHLKLSVLIEDKILEYKEDL